MGKKKDKKKKKYEKAEWSKKVLDTKMRIIERQIARNNP